jgi:hypothetical protein
MTLRLQPTFTITYEEIDLVMSKISHICSIMKIKDYAQLYRFLIGDNKTYSKLTDYRLVSKATKASNLKAGETAQEKFAFIVHYPAPEDMTANNPSFQYFPDQNCMNLWNGRVKMMNRFGLPYACHSVCSR